MVTKRNRREARQYAFQMLYANEFHNDQNDVQFPEVIFKKLWIKHMPIAIIQGVIATAEKIDADLQPFCKSRKVGKSR